MKIKNHLLVYSVVSGFLFALDQFLKHLARTNFNYTYYIWKPWLGWELFGNPGIAFSLNVPLWLIIFSTPFILLGLIFWLIKIHKLKNNNWQSLLGAMLIIAGALSNYIDRVMFGITIDYLRILTSIINLADIMIMGGVVLLLLKKHE